MSAIYEMPVKNLPADGVFRIVDVEVAVLSQNEKTATIAVQSDKLSKEVFDMFNGYEAVCIQNNEA